MRAGRPSSTLSLAASSPPSPSLPPPDDDSSWSSRTSSACVMGAGFLRSPTRPSPAAGNSFTRTSPLPSPPPSPPLPPLPAKSPSRVAGLVLAPLARLTLDACDSSLPGIAAVTG